MTPLKLVSLDDVVVFPGMPVTLPASGADDRRVLLIPRRGSGYAKVGVVAEVSERAASGGRGLASFMALHRGVPGAALKPLAVLSAKGPVHDGVLPFAVLEPVL